MTSAFLMGTLQAMTINAVLQVKSERQAQANFLIQQDIERIQATASNMGLDNIQNSSVLNPGNLTNEEICNRSRGAAAIDKKDKGFGADLVNELDDLLSKDINSHGNNDTTTKSSPAISNKDKIFSNAPGNVVVQILMNGSDNESDPNFDNNLLNKNYRLVRLMTVDDQTNYDVLQVYYRMGEPYVPGQGGQDQDGDTLRDDESIIAENYAEVMPAAVAECALSPTSE
ncbi:hypothetical protein [Crocosphaera sp.]|uniref:hypothetical protein n=1 Tax=Crocosphaera sp. TaxID=2729996 RepID=UPI00261519F2|nr:hypothetical protein [Crocosphaera sp.]